MALIKSNTAGTLVKGAIVLDLGDVAQQAKRLRESAEQQAAQTIAAGRREAQAQAAAIREEARQQGHKAGYEQGLQEGRDAGRKEAHQEMLQALAALEARWSQAAAQFDAQQAQLDREARMAVLELAVKLAHKIVHRVVEVDPAVVQDQVAEALSHVLRPHDVTIRVHPLDHALAAEALPKLTAQFRELRHVQVVEDQAVDRGGCIVSAGQGEIDARVETQLQRISELLLPAKTS